MNLSTATRKAMPSSRIVLLRGIERGGFEFYTNYRSRKGLELAANPQACLTFFWFELGRQVRAEGKVRKVPAAVSDKYFASRPRESRVGAWASDQSREVTDRQTLDERFEFYDRKFRGGRIPRPAWWGGYLLVADRMEFWQARMGRLHDRVQYDRKRNGRWAMVRLMP